MDRKLKNDQVLYTVLYMIWNLAGDQIINPQNNSVHKSCYTVPYCFGEPNGLTIHDRILLKDIPILLLNLRDFRTFGPTMDLLLTIPCSLRHLVEYW